MGRVTETIPDSRGHVRRVKVRTKSNVLERPITKLCFLLEASVDLTLTDSYVGTDI